jgi:hypothetical protein
MEAKMIRNSDVGSSMVETIVATALLLVVVGGLGSMGVVGMMTTENQGHLAARTTEYAQDKMEQLLVLAWGDEDSDTRVFPAAELGGTGLKFGGSSNPDAPTAGYADYLTKDGNLVAGVAGAPPADWYYKRVWAVTKPLNAAGAELANIKQIVVTVTVKSSLGQAMPAKSTVAALKTFPF